MRNIHRLPSASSKATEAHLQLTLHSVDLLEGLSHDLTDQVILLCVILAVLIVDK